MADNKWPPNYCHECKYSRRRYKIFGELVCTNELINHCSGKHMPCKTARNIVVCDRGAFHRRFVKNCPYWAYLL